jgi:photosystem II stability/assembly factor-like uncharacterized protein
MLRIFLSLIGFITIFNCAYGQGTVWEVVLQSANNLDGFFIDANTGWLSGNGGIIQKTTDGGITWKPQNSNSTKTLPAIYFIDAEIGWALESDGNILKTTDGGVNWMPMITGVPFNGNDIYFTDPFNGLIASAYGVYRSVDGGTSWSFISLSPLESISRLRFTGPLTGYALGIGTGGATSIYKTIDGGATWTSISTFSQRLFDIDFYTPTSALATSEFGKIYKSTDGGLTWSLLSTISGAGDMEEICHTDTSHFFTIEDDTRIYKSTNGGASFSFEGNGGFTDVVKINSTTVYGIKWDGMRVTVDNGVTFTNKDMEDAVSLNSVCFFNKDTGWVFGQNNVIRRTLNGGITWTSQTTPLSYTDMYDSHMFNFNDGVVAIGNGSSGLVRYTPNAGANWIDPGFALNHENVYGLHCVGDTCWGACTPGEIIRTTDKGLTWTDMSGSFPELNGIFFINSQIGWVVGDGGYIAKSTNAGNTWTTQPSGTSNVLVEVHFTDANNGWVVGHNGAVLKTSDGGATWTDMISDGMHYHAVWFDDANSGWISGTSGNVLKTTDGGITWQSVLKTGFMVSDINEKQNTYWATNYNTLYRSGCATLKTKVGTAHNVCEGQNASFVVISGGASSLQWQVDTDGTGPLPFTNIANGVQYAGTNTDSLTVLAPSASMNNYRYRCVSTCTDTSYSYEMILHVSNLTVNAGSDLNVCNGQTVTLTATGAPLLTWNLGVLNGVSFTPTATQQYIVTGADTYGSCSATDTVVVVVNLVYNTTVNTYIMIFDSLFVGGAYQFTTGLYTDFFSTVAGCDSTFYTNLVVLIAGDLDSNGVITLPEIAGDADFNGTLDTNEIAGDLNGDGIITVGLEVAGDTNGNGVIDGSELCGDVNGDGVIGVGEILGDINGNGIIDAGGFFDGGGTSRTPTAEICGDTNGNGFIDNGEIAGDMNNGSIGVGEYAGDLDGNGAIDGSEFCGDINGNTTLDIGEILGDLNGNGVLEATEVSGDANCNGVLDPDEGLGINNGTGNISCSIFPNPAGNTLNIVKQGLSDVFLDIYDQTSRLVYSQYCTDSKTIISLTQLSDGIYMIHIYDMISYSIIEKVTVIK